MDGERENIEQGVIEMSMSGEEKREEEGRIDRFFIERFEERERNESNCNYILDGRREERRRRR